MSYAFYYDVPGDEHIYEKVKAEIGEERPKGLRLLLVVRGESGGLRHFHVWESRADWERFAEGRVQPAVAAVLAGMGLADPPPRPTETEMEMVDLIATA